MSEGQRGIHAARERIENSELRMCLFPPFGGNADRQRGLTRSKRGIHNSEMRIQNSKCACFLPLGEMPIGKGGLHVTRERIQN
jgi:hypothetical protein